MRFDSKQVARAIFPAMFMAMLLLTACENDLSKIKEISAKLTNQPVEITKGVEVIYSDSAKVKGKMITPLLIHHTIDSPYYEMPKGVKVIFYENGRETGNIVSDSAVQREKENIIEFHRNVVGTNSEGGIYRSDELIWDQNKQIIYSNKFVTIVTPDGSVINSINFKSDDKLNNPVFSQSTGTIMVADSTSQ